MSSLSLVRAGPEHGAAIRRLLADVFPDNPKTDERIMSWQYWDNPYGAADSLAWFDGEEVVCHCASLPVPLRTRNRTRLGVISVDAATATGYRDRGLYQELLTEAVRVGRERDLGISLYFETRAGPSKRWDVAKVRLEPFVLPLDAGWLGRRLHVPRLVATPMIRMLARLPSAGDAREVEDVPDGLDGLWGVTHSSGEWGIVKDETWWRWRFGSHPHRVYRFFEVRENGLLRGAAATRSVTRGGARIEYVLELLATDEDAARAVIGSVARSSPSAAALLVRATRDSPLAQWASASGFRRVPDRLEGEHPWVTWWPSIVGFEGAGTLPWAITLGDTDTI